MSRIVTFLIGSGFDLNLGLKTRYADFYPHYVRDPEFASTDREIHAFKKNFHPNPNRDVLWADFEKALGLYTTSPPLDQEHSLRKCLQDFKRCFARYLQSQELLIDFDACLKTMSDTFQQDLLHFTNYLPSSVATHFYSPSCYEWLLPPTSST